MAGRFDQTIDQLIKDQTSFVQGIQPIDVGTSSLQSSTVPLTGAFQPNLDQALNTGFRADTGSARKFATDASNLTLRDTLARIAQQSAAKGLTGSSAQSQQGLTAGVDLATLLGERLANLELGADEAAAGRRVQSFDAALGQASAANATRALDLDQFGRENQFGIDRAGLELAGLTSQAGAGQDLLSSLLRQNPLVPDAPPPVQQNTLAPSATQQRIAQNNLARIPGGGDTGGRNLLDLRRERFLPIGSASGQQQLDNQRRNVDIRRQKNIRDFGAEGTLAQEMNLSQIMAQLFGA